MQHYFIKQNLDQQKELTINSDDLHHLKKVMRYKNEDKIICIDELGVYYQCIIKDIDNGLLLIDSKLNNNNELDVDVTLIYALPKGDKFEYVLQKATELGVKRIVPLLSNRCVVKTTPDKFNKKIERYQKILKEASEQSHRNFIPTITNVIKVKELSKYLGDYNLVAYEEVSKQGEHGSLGKILMEVKEGNKITIIVGSEGGFDQEEIDQMIILGVNPCSLGKRILRSETAPIYMLSVIGYLREIVK